MTSGRSTLSSSVSALASSTIWRAAKVSSEVRAVTSMSTPILPSWRRAAAFMARQLTMPKRVKRSSCAEIDVFGDRQVEQQRLFLEHHADAVRGGVARVAHAQRLAVERQRAARRAGSVPASTRISVDLPAPFSPISPTTSFGRISIETSFSAWTPGKDLLMPVACEHGGHLTILRRTRSSDSATAAMIIRPCTVCWM